MAIIHRIIPILITLLGLGTTTALVSFYLATQHTQRLIAETTYFATGWDAEVVEAAFRAIAEGETLPCPAYTQRTHAGASGTFVLAAEVRRAQTTSPREVPMPTCDESSTYVIRVRAGSTQYPEILQGELTLDVDLVLATSSRLLRPSTRSEQPLAFTSELE